MAFDISRRFLLTGSAGAAVAGLTACATSGAGSAVAQGAFTPENASVENPYLLGAPEGVALLSRNENPYGPAQSAKDMIAYAASKGAYYTSGEATMMLKEMIA